MGGQNLRTKHDIFLLYVLYFYSKVQKLQGHHNSQSNVRVIKHTFKI
jgi:hypothetical protein